MRIAHFYPSGAKARAGNGFSIVEAVLASGLAVMAAAALGSNFFGSAAVTASIIDNGKARRIAGEGIEAVRAIKNDDFEALNLESSALVLNGGSWRLAGEGTAEQIGKFSRTVYFDPVFRLAGGNFAGAEEPGTEIDQNSKIIRVLVGWRDIFNEDRQIERTALMTEWSEIREATSTP